MHYTVLDFTNNVTKQNCGVFLDDTGHDDIHNHFFALLGFDVPSCMILFKSRSQFVYALPIPKPAPRITGQLLPKTHFQN